jgi:hypothetical protein
MPSAARPGVFCWVDALAREWLPHALWSRRRSLALRPGVLQTCGRQGCSLRRLRHFLRVYNRSRALAPGSQPTGLFARPGPPRPDPSACPLGVAAPEGPGLVVAEVGRGWFFGGVGRGTVGADSLLVWEARRLRSLGRGVRAGGGQTNAVAKINLKGSYTGELGIMVHSWYGGLALSVIGEGHFVSGRGREGSGAPSFSHGMLGNPLRRIRSWDSFSKRVFEKSSWRPACPANHCCF